jgi:hypothetical protein
MIEGEERKRLINLLREAVAASSQAAVARRIGRSAASINQILKGNYAGNPDGILERVSAEFGGAEVDCPVMGRIPLSHCIENRQIKFMPTNHQRVRLSKECPQCGNNPNRDQIVRAVKIQ